MVPGKTLFFVVDPFCTRHSICLNIGLICHFCMEMMRFQSYCFQLKNPTPVSWKSFSFSRKSVSELKYWNCSKFSVTVTLKHADLSNEGLFWKSPVLFFRIIYGLSASFKMKLLRKSVFQCWDKNQPKFCNKTCWEQQLFIFTVYLMNHILQIPVLFNTW